jgi:hypothetical protein
MENRGTRTRAVVVCEPQNLMLQALVQYLEGLDYTVVGQTADSAAVVEILESEMPSTPSVPSRGFLRQDDVADPAALAVDEQRVSLSGEEGPRCSAVTTVEIPVTATSMRVLASLARGASKLRAGRRRSLGGAAEGACRTR